ncbi:MAG: ABC transporter substrate-binding protein, partial [Burkholderiales bacterium]
MLRVLRRLALLALAVTTFAAPPAAAQELRIGMGADVTSVDPHFVNLFPNNNIAWHVFDALVMLDAESRLIPGLAESWKTVSPTVWEFKLRKGVKFHDGTDFTADDVVFTIDRVAKVPNSPGPFTVYTKAITKVEVVDPLTVRLHTATPYPVLANDMSTIYIASRKHGTGASTADYDSGKAMIGTGPYRFGSFKRGDRVELTKNDNYWGDKSAWQRVTFRIIPSDPTRVAAL